MNNLLVYLEDDVGPLQGECEMEGERLLWERQNTTLLVYQLNMDEWGCIDKQPVTPTDWANLQAIYYMMRARGPFRLIPNFLS